MLFFHPERCTHTWLKDSTCKLCIAACPVEALNLQNSRVAVDASACVLCGICAAACPLQAFEVGVGYRQILQRAAGRTEVLFSCRALDEGEVRLPCLGFLDRALLYALAAEGIVLRLDVTGCETCPLRSGLEGFTRALDEVRAMLEQNGRSWAVTRVTLKPEVPPELLQQPPTASGEEERLPPRRQVPEKVTLCAEALRRIWCDSDDQVPWAHPRFEGEKCTVCGVCAGVCPTGALLLEEGLGTLQLRLSDCAACRACIESCSAGALSPAATAPARWLSEEVVLGSVPVRLCRRCSRFYPAREEACPYCGRLMDMVRAFYTDAGRGRWVEGNER